jgi:hypothetical protein
MIHPDAWKEWLGSSSLSREKRRDCNRFVSNFGLAYAFLFTEPEGKLILDRTSTTRRRFSFVSSLMVEARGLTFRFSRDFRETYVEVSPRDADFEWIDDQAAALLLLTGELNGEGTFPPQAIDMPPAAYVIRSRFQELEDSFSPDQLTKTRLRLDAIYRCRSQQGPLQIVNIREPGSLSDSDFLANYSRISDDISRVPFWKPLGIYVGMILLLPILLLFLLFAFPLRFFRQPSAKGRPQRRR